MNEIPCTNCITLGICKAIYVSRKDDILLMHLRLKFEKKCCLLDRWMKEKDSIHSSKCDSFHTFFNHDYISRFYR